MAGPIGVAILGAGIFARAEHLPAVLDCPDLSLKAVYSRSRDSADSFVRSISKPGFDDVAVYYEKEGDEDSHADKHLSVLLARKDIQAVIVALPITSQPQVIKAALLAGKHVLSEKPIAEKYDSGVELIKWYTKEFAGKQIWSVGENYRFNQHYEHAAKVANESLGCISFFSYKKYANVQHGDKYLETTWRKNPQYQGGFLLDGGVHHAAAIRLVVGEVAKICAFTQQVQSHLPPCDTFNAILRLQSGASGTFTMSFGSSKKEERFTVVGEKGSLVIEGWTVTHFDAQGNEVSKKQFPTGASPGVHAEVATFAEDIKKGNQDKRATPIEALKDLYLIEAILRSGEKDGEPIVLEVASF